MQQRLAFTLDTNCIIAVDESRPEAAAIRWLADAHACGKADVAVVAIMASERQRCGQWLEGFQTFETRLTSLAWGILDYVIQWLIGVSAFGITPFGLDPHSKISKSVFMIFYFHR